MTRITFTWPFFHKDSNNTKPSTLARSPRTPIRRQRVSTPPSSARTKTPPKIAERDSSLYRSRVSDLSATTYGSSSSLASCDTPLSIYRIHDTAELYFPAPPSRLSLSFDRRHTDVWDDLFDWAEAYQPKQEPLTCQSQIDFFETTNVPSRRFSYLDWPRKASSGAQSEIWTKSYLNDMSSPAPIVPPRSRLRSVAPPPIFGSTPYTLPVDNPLDLSSPERTPALSRSGSSDHGGPIETPVSPDGETLGLGRRKKSLASLGKDPLRIRDGTSPRSSTSGVYTPLTFPGAQGPRPSHFPSHVYTPSHFQLNPTSPTSATSTPVNYTYTAAGPSRSASVSSAESDMPMTPASSNSRFSSFSGKAMNGFKRISHQIKPTSSPPAIKMPLSARDSYFPSSIGNDVQRVNAPSTPIATPRAQSYSSQRVSFSSYGLGVGLSESNGQRLGSSPESSPSSRTVSYDESSDKVSPQAKGRRKPVPKMLDESLSPKMEQLTMETSTRSGLEA